MKSSKELFLIVLLALLVRVPWILLVPQVEAPDENTHFWVVQFIVNNWQLPNFDIVTSVGSEAVYGSIPQLGYLPHIILVKCLGNLVNLSNLFYIARLGSLLMGLVVIGVSHYMGKMLFPAHRLYALALPAMIIFHPQFVFVTSYINNDSTAAALGALILFLLLRSVETGLNKTNMLCLAICCACLILSKYSGYCLLITTAITILLVLYLHREKLKEQLTYLIGMIVAILILTSWWFVRNYFVFAGDITGVKTMHSIWTLTYHKHLQNFNSPLGVLFSSQFWRMLFFSFWGWFGYMTRSLPRFIYYGYLSFVVWAGLSFVFAKVKHKMQWSWLILILSFLLNLSVCIYGTYSGVAGPQGRYLFPSEIPIMAMLIAGVTFCSNKWSKYLIIALIAFNTFAYFYSSFHIFKLV